MPPYRWSIALSSGHITVPPAQGGTQNRALGRSRSGFTAKIHTRTNTEGLQIALLLTLGEADDSTAFPNLMAEYDADIEVMLGDTGYDSDAIRDEARARGGQPEIPTEKNRIVQRTVNRALYATRNRIERFFNRLKKLPTRRHPIRPHSKQFHGLHKARHNQAVDKLCPRDLAGWVRTRAAAGGQTRPSVPDWT